MKTTILFILYVLFCFTGNYCNAQNVNIVDANFKNYLIANPLINTNGDSEIQITEANSFSGQIDCSSLNISNLTGIEAFVNLTQLNCAYNQLTNLNLNSNIEITHLTCSHNMLSDLDVSNHFKLAHLYCNNNQITNLNVSNDTLLGQVSCSNNLLTNLDVSSNRSLWLLFCLSNQLNSLDLSHNPHLYGFKCNNNQLSSLNLHNGNNSIINSVNFDIRNNPPLYCIEVDNAIFSTSNWTNIDSTMHFSENCSASINQLQNSISPVLIYPNPNNGTFNINYNQKHDGKAFLNIFTLAGKKIYSIELVNPIHHCEIELNSGTYIYEYVTERNLWKKGKLIIIK